MDKEASTRAAHWSPSAINDLGGYVYPHKFEEPASLYLADRRILRSLLVVMTTLGQVSVFAPRNDPLSKQWDEVRLFSFSWAAFADTITPQ